MARSLRIEYPGAWYHVTCRGNEQRAIFADDEDRLRFLGLLEKCADAGRVEVHCFVLMDNHFHLVVTTPEANLHRFMQRFNTAYTIAFNNRHSRAGHLYQGRYKAILVDADNYLLELSRYVHLNPVRTGETPTLDAAGKIKVLNHYPWSSLKAYTAGSKRIAFLKTYKIMEMIGGGDFHAHRRLYAQFVLSGVARERQESIWSELHGRVVLGSEGFVDWVRQRFVADREPDSGALPALKALGRRNSVDMEAIASLVAAHFEIDEADLLRPYAGCRQARSIFLELCCRNLSAVMSLAEIGRRAGNIGIAALSQNKKRLENRMNRDPELLLSFESLKTAIDETASTGKF